MQYDIKRLQINQSVDWKRYDGTRFSVIVLLAALAMIAGYNGWVQAPRFEAHVGLGAGAAALIAVVALFVALNSTKAAHKNIAVVVMFVAALFARPAFKAITDSLADLKWREGQSIFIAMVVVVVVALWCARR